MKKAAIIGLGFVIAWFVLVESGVLNALAYFWLVGAVPGTSYSFSPLGMSIMIVLLMSLLLLRSSALIMKVSHILLAKYKASRQSLPKRRYSSVAR